MANSYVRDNSITPQLEAIFQSIYSDEMDPLVAALAATQSRLGMWDLNVETKKVVWSNRMKEMTGILPDTDIGYDYLMSIVHPDDIGILENLVQKTIVTGTSFHLQYRIIRPCDNKIVWFDNTGEIILNSENKPIRVMGSMMDITELKQAELRAVSSDKSKSEFLANMSHEIRTPMNGIMGMAELLQNSQLGPRETDFVNVINRSGKALLTIINDILDFSKIEAGQMKLDSAPFHLRDSIEDVTTLLSTKVTETGVDLLLRIQPDLPSTYLGDVGRIRQILTNIVGNAVKFTHTGHVLIDVSGEVENETVNLLIKVVDTGIGIPADKLSHVFDKFSQADGSTTREYGGTGLGLPISQNLIELMDGNLSVDSILGEGSTFTISINLPIGDDIITPKLEHLNIAGSKILVIDDNEVNRDILKEQITHWNCQCLAVPSATTGMAVLDRAKQKNIKLDLIIVDYQMPESNGEDFVKALKAHPDHAEMPVIMLSSVDRSELRSRMDALQISAFLTKPARGSVLHNTIGEVLCSKAMTSAQSQDEKTATANATTSSRASDHVDVLIAEDNDVNQMYVKFVMEDLGLSYKIVPNGRVAVDKWKLLSPKIILMDISMPEMNGYEATAAIRQHEGKNDLPRTPIIAVTAHAMKQDQNICLENDMDDYLSKPLSINNLIEKLKFWGVMDETSAVRTNSAV